MAERMTSESWRVVRFSLYTVLWSEESAKTINQSVSDSQVNHMTMKPFLYTVCNTKLYSKTFVPDPS